MEAMNNILSFPADDLTLLKNHDLPIRRFCPARIHHDHQLLFDSNFASTDITYQQLMDDRHKSSSEEDARYVNTTGSAIHFHDHDTAATATSITPNLGGSSSEMDDLVDSFINADPNHPPPVAAASGFHLFHDEMETFDFMFDHHQHDQSPDAKQAHEMGMDGDSFQDLLSLPSQEAEDSTPRVDPDQHDQDQSGASVDQGLQLVHLLLACAEAVGCRDTNLAESLLNQIWSSVNPWGDSLQRVSHCFATGLKSRLSLLLNNVNPNGTFANGGAANDVSSLISTREERLEAFHLLHQTTPYIAFGFMAANEAIAQAAQGKDSLHIIDLGMEHTLQWPSLLRTLSSRPGGPPKKVRITGLTNGDWNENLAPELESLAREAQLLGIARFEFDIIVDPVSPALFTAETLDLKTGETLFVNGIMNLHKFVKESRGSLKAILQSIKRLSPALLTVVEQDANHNGPFFLGRFLESLHYYSAVFDSLEASRLQRNSVQRVKMERHHFAEEIRNIVAYEGTDRVERHERADQWRRQLGRAGFQVVEMKSMSQARMMLSVYGCDGYTLGCEKEFLLLGWKGRPIMLASAWQVHPHHTAAAAAAAATAAGGGGGSSSSSMLRNGFSS